MNGTGLVDSANVASQEIDPALAGEDSKVGLSEAVMPARVNVTPATADAGEYVTLMLNDWIFDPAGWSTPSGVPATSRTYTGTSTVVPDAVTVSTVTAS